MKLSVEQHVSDVSQEVAQLQDATRIFEAVKLFDSLPEEERLSAAVLVGKSGGDVERLRADVEETQKLLADLKDETDFKVSADGAYKILYKQEGAYHKFMIEMSIESSLTECMALAWEYDLVKTWNKFCTDTQKLSEPEYLHMFAYSNVWTPWPITQRQLVMKARGFDLLEEHNCVIYLANSEENAPKGSKPLPDGAFSRTYMHCRQSGGVLIPLSPTLTRTRLLFTINPFLPSIPEWLMSTVLGKMLPWVLDMVLHYLQAKFKDPNDVYVLRMKSNCQVYDRLGKRVHDKLDE
eukprot:CAMPEP_0196583682 /NCGR_PEP_ID=MMETSP1081-20130531/44317_1 /TAXON_ID=36882 /ORGANISM="Pyramimonas amylifera, Strain CCMP720" /LENGTH=293 /DNA_ID=CAMNT_0041904637 /DNA_START=161 /DNA_END=1045 /DNA_ORIENTATION=-